MRLTRREAIVALGMGIGVGAFLYAAAAFGEPWIQVGGEYRAGCAITADTTLTVAVTYAGPISIAVALITLEYNGDVARFRGVEAAESWYVATVNDDQHVDPCHAVAPLRRVSVIVSGDYIECDDGILDGPLARFKFGRVSPGETPLVLVPGRCGDMLPNHGSDCIGAVLIVPGLVDGCLRFDAVTDVSMPPATWSSIKRLYR